MVPGQGPCSYDIKDDHGYRGKGPWAVVLPRQELYYYDVGSESEDALKGELLSDRDFSSSFPPVELRKSGKTHKVKKKSASFIILS